MSENLACKIRSNIKSKNEKKIKNNNISMKDEPHNIVLHLQFGPGENCHTSY